MTKETKSLLIATAFGISMIVASCDAPDSPDPAGASSGGSAAVRPSGGRPTAGADAAAPSTRQARGLSPATSALNEADGNATPDRLYGTWVAHDVETSAGEVKVEVTFNREGPVKIAAWSELPLVGQVRQKKAPYEVHGNTISSDAIRGGTSVRYRFDGDKLVITYEDGKSVTFTRKA